MIKMYCQPRNLLISPEVVNFFQVMNKHMQKKWCCAFRHQISTCKMRTSHFFNYWIVRQKNISYLSHLYFLVSCLEPVKLFYFGPYRTIETVTVICNWFCSYKLQVLNKNKIRQILTIYFLYNYRNNYATLFRKIKRLNIKYF